MIFYHYCSLYHNNMIITNARILLATKSNVIGIENDNGARVTEVAASLYNTTESDNILFELNNSFHRKN